MHCIVWIEDHHGDIGQSMGNGEKGGNGVFIMTRPALFRDRCSHFSYITYEIDVVISQVSNIKYM